MRVGNLKETRNNASVLAIDGSVVPGHVFSNLRENPWEYPHLAPPSMEEQLILSEKLDTWLRQVERDQTFLIPGSVAPEWKGENLIFNTEFMDAVQPGGLSNPIQAGGYAVEGIEVSAVTPGPGIQAFRIDDSVSWTRFISESAGSSVAQTAEHAASPEGPCGIVSPSALARADRGSSP